MQQIKYFCNKLYGMKVPTQIRWEHANEKIKFAQDIMFPTIKKKNNWKD